MPIARRLHSAPRWAVAALFFAALLTLACSEEPGSDQSPADSLVAVAPEAPPLHTGDLGEIRALGRLRILFLQAPPEYLPRKDSPLHREREMAAALARHLDLEAEFVPVEGLDELIPALLEGRGDLIADNLTVTRERQQRVAFSSPVARVREWVLARSDDPISKVSELEGRTLFLRPSSAFWASGEELKRRVPGLRLEPAPERMETDELIDRVAAREFDLTIADSNLAHAALQWRDDVKRAIDLDTPRLIAWALRPDADDLRRAVDGYLAKVDVSRIETDAAHTEDLPGIRERGTLRVLTRNSAATYFIWRGQLMGFEYELARRLAERLGLRLEIVVAPSRRDLVPWLLAGKGDVIAAGLTASEERAGREGIRFSRNYLGATEAVVARTDDPVAAVEDLRGRELVVRRSSSYWHTLSALQDEAGFRLVAAPEALETEQLIARVADGSVDLTVADTHILGIELVHRSDVRRALDLGEPQEHGWAVRPGNPELLGAIDGFFKKEYRGLFYNLLVKKYFTDRGKVARHAVGRARAGTISPFDDAIRRFAAQYAFDWRLIAAQMHQESRFDPKARSFAGARGLLQVLPRTGREFGFERLEDPETGIHAGVHYLSWLRARFPPHESEQERTWMSLASYNVGVGHVRDAQRIARERGWDENRWFGHVEKAMELKEDPEVYRSTRFGYARGSEPVHYVRAVRERYDAYVQVADPLASAPRPVSTR